MVLINTFLKNFSQGSFASSLPKALAIELVTYLALASWALIQPIEGLLIVVSKLKVPTQANPAVVFIFFQWHLVNVTTLICKIP
jgi:hypothetical protein